MVTYDFLDEGARRCSLLINILYLLYILQIIIVMLSVMETLFVPLGSMDTTMWAIACTGTSLLLLTVFFVCWYLCLKCCNNKNSHEIHIGIRFHKAIHLHDCSPLQRVSDLKKAAAKHYGLNECKESLFIRFRGRKLHDENLTLEAAGILKNCEVQLVLPIRGGTVPGTGSGFASIPVKNLRPLLDAIRADFQLWRAKYDEKPVYAWGRQMGKEVVWDGMSDCVKFFFEDEEINPSEKYKEYYDAKRHTIATSYVWAKTGLCHMTGAFFPLFFSA